MHVCVVMPPFEVYGPDGGLALAIITAELTRELRARGVATTVVTPTDGTELYTGGDVVGIDYDAADVPASLVRRVRQKLVRWDAPGYDRYVRGVRGALAGLDDRPSAVVLFNDLVTGGLLRRRLPGVPTFTWLENEIRTNRRSGLRLLARTDGVFAVSGYIEGWLRGAFEGADLSDLSVSVLPNGVNPSTFHPGPGGIEPTPRPELRTCFVGRIDPNKGPLLAAEAVARARQRGHAVTIDVAGPVNAWGCPADVLDAYVARLERTLEGSEGRWVGAVGRDELPAFYRGYDLCFVPSVSNEPFGLVALEAMASGCAVIASDRGGLPEVCGGAAALVDPEDPAAFDAALDRFAGSPDALLAARRAGRRRAEDCAWGRTADLLLAAIAAAT